MVLISSKCILSLNPVILVQYQLNEGDLVGMKASGILAVHFDITELYLSYIYNQ